MTQDVPIPAEAARQIAIEASNKIDDHRSADRKATARRLEEQVSTVMASLEGRDGEYVSVEGTALASLTAEATIEAGDYSKTARHYLEQYNVW